MNGGFGMAKFLLPGLMILLVSLWAGQVLWADEPAPAEPKADAPKPTAEAPKNSYVGDVEKKCMMCHKTQVQAWKEWPMATAWGKLSAEEQKKEECIKCHVTGYGQEGGWVSFEKTPNLVGVQCEACHGPAGEHMKIPMADKEKRKASMSVPDEAKCLTCHVASGNPNFKEFKYKDAVTKLASHLNKK
jgi:hypothetical protein